MIRRTALLLAAALLVGLSGCAGDDTAVSEPAASSDEPSATGSASESATDDVVEITVSVRDGKVSPAPRRVEVAKDSQVRLLVTSDVDDAVHVHGAEIEEPLEAGRTTTVEFVADQDGVFEVETHDSGLELLQLEVR